LRKEIQIHADIRDVYQSSDVTTGYNRNMIRFPRTLKEEVNG